MSLQDSDSTRHINIGFYLNEADFIIDLLDEFLAAGRIPSQPGVNPFAIKDFLEDKLDDERRCHEECANRCGCGQCHVCCIDLKAFKPWKQVVFRGGCNLA